MSKIAFLTFELGLNPVFNNFPEAKILSEKQNLKKSNQYIHAFYRLNFFINKDKIKQNRLIYLFNKNKINCGVGACPEIYREKIFKKLKFYPKKG